MLYLLIICAFHKGKYDLVSVLVLGIFKSEYQHVISLILAVQLVNTVLCKFGSMLSFLTQGQRATEGAGNAGGPGVQICRASRRAEGVDVG